MESHLQRKVSYFIEIQLQCKWKHLVFISTVNEKKLVFFLRVRVWVRLNAGLCRKGVNHGLINYIDTNAKCRHLKNWAIKGLCDRCLSEFIDWRYTVMLVFSTHAVLWTVAPQIFSGSTLPPPPFHVYLYTRIQCLREGDMRFWASDAAKSLYRPFFLHDEVLYCFLWSYLSTV